MLVSRMSGVTEGVMMPHKQRRVLTRGSLGSGLLTWARQISHRAAPTQIKWCNLKTSILGSAVLQSKLRADRKS